MKRILSENDFIKKNCKIACNWDQKTQKWTVKINHITNASAYTGVCVVMEGFENFREATDTAVNLFKRNIRNKVRDLQVTKVTYKADDIWPDLLMETA